MPAQGSFSTTWGGQTALNSGSAKGHDASPFKTSISMLIALLTSRAARPPHTRRTEGNHPMAAQLSTFPAVPARLDRHNLRCLSSMEPSIRVPVKPTSPIIFGHHPMTFTLPSLPYAYDALAPHMSKETLEYHHDKHHQAYVTNGNNLLKGTEFEGKSLEEIVKGSFGKNAPLFNNAGQHYNHMHFWNWMKKGGGGDKLPAKLQAAVDKALGGIAKAKTNFIAAGVGQFGSGWAWIAVKDGKLMIDKTPNGESPLVKGASPILGVDVWEHAYYIDYRNLRPKYLEAFWDSLINWEHVEEMFSAASK